MGGQVLAMRPEVSPLVCVRRLGRALWDAAEVVHGYSEGFGHRRRRLKKRARLSTLVPLDARDAHAGSLREVFLAHAGVCTRNADSVPHHRLEVGQSTHPRSRNRTRNRG